VLRKILTYSAWAIGGLAALCVLLYLVGLLLNRHDQEPSATALRLTAEFRDRPAVPDEENSFVLFLGFGVPPGEDPFELGLKRVEWLRRTEEGAVFDYAADPMGEPQDFEVSRHPAVREYLQSCGARGPDCRAELESAILAFEDWKESDAWLLERYRALIAMNAWREYIPTNSAGALPLTSYGKVTAGQKLLLLQVALLASRRDATGAKELLEQDLRFWRGVLASSDELINKMVATAAILAHFKLGMAAIRGLPPEQVNVATPAAWHDSFTEAERSMQRCLTAEWIFMSGVVRHADRVMSGVLTTEGSFADKALDTLATPFYQPQDTINRHAEQITRISELLENVRFMEYEAATNRVTELARQAARESHPPRSLYNVIGQMMLGYMADYGSYARRLGDLEGVRLATLAAVALREESVAPESIAAALAHSPFRNPYDGQPFAWDAADAAVVFGGLEPGKRGEHRIH
jgi:hypothetical protein